MIEGLVGGAIGLVLGLGGQWLWRRWRFSRRIPADSPNGDRYRVVHVVGVQRRLYWTGNTLPPARGHYYAHTAPPGASVEFWDGETRRASRVQR